MHNTKIAVQQYTGIIYIQVYGHGKPQLVDS